MLQSLTSGYGRLSRVAVQRIPVPRLELFCHGCRNCSSAASHTVSKNILCTGTGRRGLLAACLARQTKIASRSPGARSLSSGPQRFAKLQPVDLAPSSSQCRLCKSIARCFFVSFLASHFAVTSAKYHSRGLKCSVILISIKLSL